MPRGQLLSSFRGYGCFDVAQSTRGVTVSGSLKMPCPSCGSELSRFTKNPLAGHPCPLCGYVGFASLPAPIRRWFSEHLAILDDGKQARTAIEQLVEHMTEEGYDERSKFAARLAFEEALLAAIRRQHGI